MPVPSTEVHDVRISVVSVAPGALAGAPVAIAEVDLPETTSGRTLDVPRSIGAETTVLLGNQAPRRACVDIGYGPHCETSEIRTTEWNGFDRQLHVVEAGSWDLSGTVVADAGAAAAALLGPLGAAAATVTSDSVFGGDPAVSGVFAFDGLAGTPWLADPGDSQATLHLRWTGERTVSRLVVDPAHVPAAEPIRARIESSAGVRMVDLRDFGLFEPLRARDGLSITLYRPASAEAGLPLGVGEVRIERPGGSRARSPARPPHDRRGVRTGTRGPGRRHRVPDRGDRNAPGRRRRDADDLAHLRRSGGAGSRRPPGGGEFHGAVPAGVPHLAAGGGADPQDGGGRRRPAGDRVLDGRAAGGVGDRRPGRRSCGSPRT